MKGNFKLRQKTLIPLRPFPNTRLNVVNLPDHTPFGIFAHLGIRIPGHVPDLSSRLIVKVDRFFAVKLHGKEALVDLPWHARTRVGWGTMHHSANPLMQRGMFLQVVTIEQDV